MPQDPLLLSTAVEAVLHAGAMQVAALGQRIRIDKKGVIDLVTEVDLAVETWFRAFIRERFPEHRVLAEELQAQSEEGAEQGAASSPYCWIFDPIDGTTNYAHGLPIFCASLGLEIAGRLEVAAIYDPTRKELFTAERGGGAFLNGAPIHVSHTATLIDALLCTGFHYQVHQSSDEVVGLFSQFIGRARAVRRLGSAALDLCYVACGRFDGFWEERLRPWDVAGGVLLIEEAGGRISGYDGAPYTDPRRGDLVATNGAIHAQMLDVIRHYQTQMRAI
jgi:myo-inositol-1(or 4)-monophosphatase